MHILFPVFALGLIFRLVQTKGAPTEIWADGAIMIGLLFIAVLLHEYGHCFGARLVDGDATEIMIWPLGGLAAVEVPHTARANLYTAAAGPLVNLSLCLLLGAILFAVSVWPPIHPLWEPIKYDTTPKMVSPELYNRAGEHLGTQVIWWKVLLARFFWVNWLLFILNTVLVAFPMDMGRILQCALWPRYGFRQATHFAVTVGFVVALIVGIGAIVKNELLFFMLAIFIYMTCRQQIILLETAGEESVFGYDFSQGYTSLERENSASRRRRPSVWQRWWQKRQARKLQREMEQREAEENRMDELLEKVQREGLQSLSDEERRFLTRVSAKYRNRQ